MIAEFFRLHRIASSLETPERNFSFESFSSFYFFIMISRGESQQHGMASGLKWSDNNDIKYKNEELIQIKQGLINLFYANIRSPR